jgi:hypothetical protein
VQEVQDWLLQLGWAFFWCGDSFGLIETDTTNDWTRLGSKRISDDLDEVAEGQFDFERLAKVFHREAKPLDD